MDLQTRGRTTFVPALREPRAQVVEVEVMRELPSAPIVPPMPYSGHVDRAKGFGIATCPLAGVAGVVAALVGFGSIYPGAAACRPYNHKNRRVEQ